VFDTPCTDINFTSQVVVRTIHPCSYRCALVLDSPLVGPEVAAASIVLSVLNGLKEMDNRTPRITLFTLSERDDENGITA